MKTKNLYIERPVFTCVLSLLLIIIGVICYLKLPLRYLPKITVPVVTISTDYPGASSTIVETQVTTILEDAMSGVQDLEHMMSTSQDGNSNIMLTFKLGSDIDDAVADIRDRISKTVDELPSEIPVISKTDPNAQPVLFLAYFDSNESIGALTNYVKQFIVPQFEASKDVANVLLWSRHHYALRIWLHPDKMAARGITVDEVTELLESQNDTVPTGSIEGDSLSYTIVADLTLENPAEFSNLIIRNNDNLLVRLKDIATVEMGNEHRTSDTQVRYFSVSGKSGVAIGIVPEAGANVLDMTSKALELSEKIANSLPSGMKYIVEYNESEFTEAALHSVYNAIFEAFILVLLVITLFLGSIRSSLVPIVTIPICLIGSFAVIYALGYTINSITLLALVLAVGLVVDDAIIMLENISRFIEEGEPPLSAALKGAKQITFPIISMTMTLAAIYLPIAFSGGISGVIFKEFAFTLLGSIFISGFLALTLSPMMCSKILRASSTESSYAIYSERLFKRLQSGYHRYLSLFLARSQWALSGLTLLMFIGIGTFYLLPKDFAPAMNMPLLSLSVQTSPQDSFSRTQSFIPQFEKVLDETPEVQDYLMQNWKRGSFYAAVVVKQDEVKNSHQIASRLQDKFSNIPGTQVNIGVVPPPLTWSLPSVSPGEIEVKVLTTGSYEQLRSTMQELVKETDKHKDIVSSNSNLKWDTRQLKIHLNRELAADLDIPINKITDTLETMLGGKQVGKYNFGSQNVDVIIQLPEEKRQSLQVLEEIYVRSNKNEMIALQSLVRISEHNAPSGLEHYNRLRSGTLTVKLASNISIEQGINVLGIISKETLPSNTTIAFSGSAQQYLEYTESMIWLFLFALIFIYLILAAQFESFVEPLVILTCVPFALIGALLLLKVTGNSLNLYSGIALITLIGLIVKHGILITQFAKQKLEEGELLLTAILDAATLRLRPILMTTSATVLGALPLALAIGPGSENRQQIGLVIVGGLLLGTFISLFVVPLAFTFIKSIGKNKDE